MPDLVHQRLNEIVHGVRLGRGERLSSTDAGRSSSHHGSGTNTIGNVRLVFELRFVAHDGLDLRVKRQRNIDNEVVLVRRQHV